MAEVRVIRVGSIPYGLSALVDEQQDSLVVWLLESDWPEEMATLVEQALKAVRAGQGDFATAVLRDLHSV